MKTIISLFVCVLMSLTVFSQQTVSVTGGDATGGSGSVSFTVGQVFYGFNTGTNMSEAQGVQQPYEIFVITNTQENPEISLEIMVYPNPTDGQLVLNTGSISLEHAYFRITDLNGKLLYERKLTDQNTDIQMYQYPTGVYLLEVSDKDITIKIFKIIKK